MQWTSGLLFWATLYAEHKTTALFHYTRHRSDHMWPASDDVTN